MDMLTNVYLLDFNHNLFYSIAGLGFKLLFGIYLLGNQFLEMEQTNLVS